MLWAAYYTAFFGFLRSGEVTVPSLAAYDLGAHLSYGDNFQQPNSPNTCPGKYKSIKNRPLSYRGVDLLGKNKLRPMSSSSTGSLPCSMRIRGRSIFPIQRGHSLVQREYGGEVKRAPSRSRGGLSQIFGT